MLPDAAGLTLDNSQDLAARTCVDPDSRDPLIPLLGLTGEVAALAAECKKERADSVPYSGFQAGATERSAVLDVGHLTTPVDNAG